jgi:hypothetical protein
MRLPIAAILAWTVALSGVAGAQLIANGPWGPVQSIEFGKDELPANLYSMYTGNEENSVLQYCLPQSYSTAKEYPLVLYVPGFHGQRGGNLRNAKDIAEGHDCIVASLPLFKADFDPSEVGNGIIVSFSDYRVLSDAYEVILQRLFDAVPNIDPAKSAMVGFSNGAISIAVLVSSRDEFILERFHGFCLVDHGMFHLTDLYKHPTKNRRFLIMVGDQEDYGRELKLRGAQLLEDSYRPLGIDVESRVLENTGHELTNACKKDIGTWIFE